MNGMLDSNIINFIVSKANNKWIKFDEGEVYVRKSMRYFDKNIWYKALDLANINIKEEHRGKGYLTFILEVLENAAKDYGYDIVYLENVLDNPRLEEFYKRKGYLELSRDIPCFYKPVKEICNVVES